MIHILLWVKVKADRNRECPPETRGGLRADYKEQRELFRPLDTNYSSRNLYLRLENTVAKLGVVGTWLQSGTLEVEAGGLPVQGYPS